MVAIQNRLKAQKDRRAASLSGNKCDATENKFFVCVFSSSFFLLFYGSARRLAVVGHSSPLFHTAFIVLRLRKVALRLQKP